jgi:hypothetical protein
MISFTLQIKSLYRLKGTLDVFQSRSGHDGEEKNFFLCQELKVDGPFCRQSLYWLSYVRLRNSAGHAFPVATAANSPTVLQHLASSGKGVKRRCVGHEDRRPGVARSPATLSLFAGLVPEAWTAPGYTSGRNRSPFSAKKSLLAILCIHGNVQFLLLKKS